MATDATLSGERIYGEMRAEMAGSFTQAELDVLDRAFSLANNAHAEQVRRSGEPYIVHPLAVARILFDLGMDYQSIAAALLHDVVEDTPHPLSEIKTTFGDEIALLVDGVTKISKLQISGTEERQSESLRKMLIAMNKDVRVIIIKLADRVHNIRTLQYVPEAKRRMTAKETLEIYAPIAHRLGIRQFKEELEDKSILYLDPVAYKNIEDKLSEQEPKRREFLDDIMKKIADRVHETMPAANITGRIKSVHGIFRKMYIKGKSFDEIYDIYAVRIIVNTVEECYNCLGIMHDMYRSVPGRFKDYISTPKPNMYQSLHTTLLGHEGIPFEVQIRTWDMHRNAEYGIAAHWKYKMGRQDRDVDDRLVWLRQMLESQQESGNPGEILQDIKSDLIPDEVFVLTPKGKVVSLPQGATVIDFAYAIHSAVGNRMSGAKVNGRIVPIDYKVSTGEIVEILTSSAAGKGPSRDWLSIVATSGARSKIRAWFKKEKRDENIVEGRTQLEKELKKSGVKVDDELTEQITAETAEKNHVNSVNDFYAAIGYGGISLQKAVAQIREEYTKRRTPEPVVPEIRITEREENAGAEGIIVEGIDNCLIKFAKCCSPIPGDEVIGFITRGHGVSVHKRDCPNVPRGELSPEDAARWVRVYWRSDSGRGFNATLAITCIDRLSLLADISTTLSNAHVMIHSVNTRHNKDGTSIIFMTITVNNSEHLRGIIEKLKKIPDVINVERSGT
ncbi:MAG: bifunctional (p)ppGpp synthetase/guanosine-3',5'-bis(diphosphate) 3'-pyrophosphohydrolase [Clostridia bacterium]|nr:bifunctional (p)ppGpp synthetase/guanosine-3',5'-bis(diphosphate) 3'-pyrophosphohydrolase [Clostridia bacterium]